ncbi:hypothetical protein CEK71_11230 [Methylovulum psychrotolerans]|uniref:Uncharacterized protein n=1 Tax=Methylovulum psychrotolerans TaxID=1704499 RepID=A0A1Z4BZ87_9GAMM|nr:hypothetical protein CEK71_11230 [Methylovulum psychrotolerans]
MLLKQLSPPPAICKSPDSQDVSFAAAYFVGMLYRTCFSGSILPIHTVKLSANDTDIEIS